MIYSIISIVQALFIAPGKQIILCDTKLLENPLKCIIEPPLISYPTFIYLPLYYEALVNQVERRCLTQNKTISYLGFGYISPLILIGSLGIAHTAFVVAGGGFNSYYIHQGNKSDKGSKIARKK